MKWIKTIAWLTLAFWLIQTLVFIMLFASVFTRLVVQCFVFVGLPMPETSVHAFLLGTMKVLAWPIRPLFSSTWSDASFLTTILLLGLNSLIWGSVLGTLIYFVRRNRKSPEPLHS
jgi:hypothetical protein